jgi:hypothetical protein
VVVGFTTGAGIPFQLLNTVPKMQLAPKLAMSLDGSPAFEKKLSIFYSQPISHSGSCSLSSMVIRHSGWLARLLRAS